MAHHKPEHFSRIPRAVSHVTPQSATTIRSSSSSKTPLVSSITAGVPDRYSQSIGSRKRPRADTASLSASCVTNESYWTKLDSSAYSVGTASPAPLANSRYRLAGGMDTPTQEAATQFENLNTDLDSDLRARLSFRQKPSRSTQLAAIGALDRERNGGRLESERQSDVRAHASWGTFVVSTLGDIAGKMWDFCTAGAFRGFTAGGGTGYEMAAGIPQPLKGSDQQHHGGYFNRPIYSPIPGDYPSDDFNEPLNTEVDMRPAKRQQISQNFGWVMVDSGDQRSRPHSPSPSKYSSSLDYSPVARPPFRTAPARRTKSSVVRMTSVSYAGSPQPRGEHKRTASFVSPRIAAPLPRRTQHSPPTAAVETDIHRFSAKKEREARQSNDSMKRLNMQLQAMIKQGKEALASKVELQDGVGMDLEEWDEGLMEGNNVDRETAPGVWIESTEW